MQVEMAHPICPLCKRELSAGTLDTRLCEQCQTLIQTASRSADSSVMSVSASANQQLSVAHPQHFVLPDNLPLELQELFDDSSVSSDSFEPDPLFAALFESQDEFVTAPPNDEQSNQVDTPEANLADGSVTASTLAIIEPAREETHLDRVDAEAESPNDESANESLSDGHAVTETQASADSTTPHADVEGQIDDPKAIRDEVSADPWENPLPAWEYSQNEWPVLVGPRRDGPWARFKGP